MVSKGFRGFQMVLEGSEGFYRASKGFKGFRRVLEGF
jgi:hypothetical protein